MTVSKGVQRIVVLGGDGTASQALNGIYAAGGRDALASVAFAVRYQAADRTLTTEDASKEQLLILGRLEREFGASLRG